METVEERPVEEPTEHLIDTELLVVHGPFEFTDVGVEVTGEFSYEEWEKALKWAQKLEHALPFAIGQMVNMGEARFGEKYSQALDSTEYARHTLENYAYVERKVPKMNRRPDVPFSHHAEVAKLPADEQPKWLERCAEEQLTRDRLRGELASKKAAATGEPVTLWLVVSCANEDDRLTLYNEMLAKGRSCRYSERHKKADGE